MKACLCYYMKGWAEIHIRRDKIWVWDFLEGLDKIWAKPKILNKAHH